VDKQWLIAGLALLVVGCASSEHHVVDLGVGHRSREVALDRFGPPDSWLGVMLIRVDPDGTAVIHVKETGELLAAAPGQPFLGRYIEEMGLRRRTFGEEGLTLQSSDPSAQTAVLIARWAESFELR
jgi:hypothetical protein